MLSVSPELATAIESGDRTIDAVVSADWDGDGATAGIDDLTPLVTGYSLDRAVVGDLPDEVRLKQGSAVAQATVTLGKGPAMQAAGIIGPRIGATTATANGASAVAYATAAAPSAVVRNDLMIGVTSWSTTSGSNLPYALAQDFMSGSGLPADPGWTARVADIDDVSIRTFVDSRWASDADVTWGDTAGASYGYEMSDVCVFSSSIIALGPITSGLPGVWKIDQQRVQSAPITVTGSSHAAPTVTVTTPGTILVSVWAARVTTSVTWTKDASDTEYEEVRGTNATANVALMVAYSAPLQAGTYARTATTSASVSAGTMTVIPVVPVQGTQDQHAAWYFSPLNTAGAVSNKDPAGLQASISARFATSNGPQTVPRLTGGTARSITVDAAGRGASLKILDRREELRKAILLPTLDYRRQGCNATWLITQALHACGFQPSPPPPGVRLISEPGEPALYSSDARLAYTMHGSLARSYNLQWFNSGSVVGPPAGFYTVTAGDVVTTFAEPQFVEGPFGGLAAYGYATDDDHTGRIVDSPVSFSGRNIASSGSAYGRVSVWLRGDPDGTATQQLMWVICNGTYAGGGYQVGARVLANRVMNFYMYNTTTSTFIASVNGPSLPSDGAWHFVGISWDIEGANTGGTPTVWFRLDGSTTSSTFSPASWTSATESGSYQIASYLPISDLVAVGVPGTDPWPNQVFDQDAFVDPSLLDLRFNLERQAREAWDLITDIGKAEGAVVYIDESGSFQYRTRDRFLSTSMQTTQLTLTAARSITQIQAEHSVDVVANIVSGSYAEPYGVSDWTTNLTDPLRLPPNTQFNFFDITTDDVALSLDSSFVYVTAAPASGSYVIANTADDGSGTAITTNITATVSQATADGRIQLQIANNNGIVVYVTDLRMYGALVRTRPTTAVVEMDRASVGRHGQQPLSLSSSQWIQSEQTARLTTRNVVVDLAYPQTVITELAVRGDPRLQLLDRVRVVDEDGVAVDGDFWISGIREQQGSGGYVMRIDARAALPVAVWPFVWNQAMWSA